LIGSQDKEIQIDGRPLVTMGIDRMSANHHKTPTFRLSGIHESVEDFGNH
jgi:hypothetical protein